MLVPTTILAKQHAATFRDRFRDFPLRVEMVSRFRAAGEVKAVLAESPRARWTCWWARTGCSRATSCRRTWAS